MTTALFLAVFYELFWLDSFPVGTYIPPNALFPMLCVIVIAESMARPDIVTLFLPVILTLPLAFFGAYLEKKQREWQVAGYERVLRRFRTGGDVERPAGVSIAISLSQMFLLNFLTFFCVTFALYLAMHGILSFQEHFLVFRNASWPLLWAFGAVGGVLALRIKRSYIIFVAGAATLTLMALFGIRW